MEKDPQKHQPNEEKALELYKKRRRKRSIALAFVLVLVVIVFYVVTLIKGPGMLHRPM
jgi:predicted nucleic acid-binding Zn ribbon protein